jgi:hypothetical protein
MVLFLLGDRVKEQVVSIVPYMTFFLFCYIMFALLVAVVCEFAFQSGP